jgi:NAD(P)-dependent dehydrogenase (short-subunit alcohol dehydrogenase family)/acyl carrier protein
MTPMVAVGATTTVVQAAGVTAERDVVVVEFLRNMRSMISAQRDVMLSYLGSAPQPSVETFVAPAQVIDVVAAPIAPVPDKPAIVDPMQLVISIVSERTGYPADTLGVDLDLEADLSIDSIKRIEIIGELAERLGLRVGNGAAKEDADAMVEELAGKKTLRALVAWLSDRMAKPAAAPVDPIETAVTTPTVKSNVTAPARYTMSVVEAPLPINGHSTYAGKRFAVVGLPAIAPLLEAEGAMVRHLAAGEAVGTVDGFVHAALSGDPVSALRELFVRVREAALGGAKTIVVATSLGGRWQGEGIAGAAGLLKTIAAEYPGVKVRAVDVEPGDDVASRLHAELHAHDEHVEIGYSNGVRATIAATRTDATQPALALSSDAVVVVTGGARGITALAAIELAKRFRCRIELVGRSPYPGDEDPTLSSLADAAALRGFYAKRGLAPAEIEQTAMRILADREIRATIGAIKDAGASVTYHAVDVRTPAFGELVDTIYTRHGRIDGVIHGAGVLEDKLVRDKTPESFERVVATKLGGAHTLATRLRRDVDFVVWFASISGVYGNKGQIDYACANDALDKLAASLRSRVTGRVVSIDWGPWSGAGMVSPALAREYAKRGIGLIDPVAGIDALLAELGADRRDTQVILTSAEPQALSKPARQSESQPAARDARD